MGTTLRRLLGFARPHLGTLGLAGVCMVVLGLATGAYAWLLGPALRFLLSGGTEGLGQASRLLPWLTPETARWALPLACVVLALVKGAAYLGQFFWVGRFGLRVAADVRRALFVRLLGLSPRQMSTQQSGDLLGRFAADVSAVELAANTALPAYLRDGLQVVILVGVALVLDWRLALLSFVGLPLAAVPVARLTRAFLDRTREGQASLGQMAGQLQEGLGGLRTIQAFNGQEAELARFDAHARRNARALTRAAWVRGAMPGLMEVFAAAGLAGVLAIALAVRLGPPEALVSVLTALVMVAQPVKALGRVSQFVVQAAAAGERLFALLDVPPAMEAMPGAGVLPPLREEVRLEEVRFSYGDRPALDGLTLTLEAGKVTALVGPSGGGKSTLTQLLLRFEAPQGGRILLDGMDAASLTPDSVRAQFALVTQEPLLFDASALDNLRVARPGATREEVEAAARVAQADGFLRALPEGYDTRLGERGVKLSGGQRQRLCLARAVLANAPVLVLDEATSNLDVESEREVLLALRQVLVGRTALVIAHRLSTIVHADVIHVLSGGRVVESGTHPELLDRRGLYASLWALQQGEGVVSPGLSARTA
ncbi:MAG: ABC transporter ATP-binding protein/permease [Myxococcaceae bacterium]|nr:ABC transporter ATP-binding protein/permease [Myxococcaceae bacterium]